MYTRLINLFLRGITLFSKFLLMFSLAYYIKPEDVGLYGLFFSTIMYMIYVIGFEFYTFSNREIASQKKEYWGGVIRDQMIFVGFLSLVIMPISLLIFYLKILPWDLLFLFYPILVFEYLSQEINRFLISMSRQLKASIVLFFRGGLWPIITIGVFYLFPDKRNLNTILFFWILGGISAILVGIYFIRDVFQDTFHRKFSTQWVISGVKVAIPLLMASLASKAFFTFDRFFVEFFSNLEQLAPYIFFASIASSISAFIDAAVIVFFYPKMIKAGSDEKIGKLIHMVKDLSIQIISLGCVISFFLIPFTIYILDYFKHNVYHSYLYFLYYSIGATIVFCLSMSPHLALYALNKDKYIVLSNIMGLVFFVVSAFFLGSVNFVDGVLDSLLLSCVFLLGIKFYFLRKVLLRYKL